MEHTTENRSVSDVALLTWLARIRDFMGSTEEAQRFAQEAINRLTSRPASASAMGAIAEQVAKNRAAYSAEHDDGHVSGELLDAASCYLEWAGQQVLHGRGDIATLMAGVGVMWPFEPESWKPSNDPIRNLAHAGALIVAEIERLLRQESPVDSIEEHGL